MNETENALLIIDRIERKIRELHHFISGMVKEAEAYRAEIARLSRINTELESQMRRMVADKACTGCDWRDQDGGMIMREILFRGKRIDNGEWVEGFYTIGRVTGLSTIEGETISYIVDPATVGQYTGLNDKNGKRIFEGDVVQYSELRLGGEDAPVAEPVKFEEGGFCTRYYFLNNWLRDAVNGNIRLEGIEVIGNIHDNPELMEV